MNYFSKISFTSKRSVEDSVQLCNFWFLAVSSLKIVFVRSWLCEEASTSFNPDFTKYIL
jgi:hypothetical protein